MSLSKIFDVEWLNRRFNMSLGHPTGFRCLISFPRASKMDTQTLYCPFRSYSLEDIYQPPTKHSKHHKIYFLERFLFQIQILCHEWYSRLKRVLHPWMYNNHLLCRIYVRTFTRDKETDFKDHVMVFSSLRYSPLPYNFAITSCISKQVVKICNKKELGGAFEA